MSTSPVTLDFSKAEPVTLDFSKAQPINAPQPSGWLEKAQALLGVKQKSFPEAIQEFDANAKEQRDMPTWEKALNVAGLAAGPIASKAIEAIPSMARAGEAFQSVSKAAGKLPVDIGAAQDAAFEAEKFAKTGGTLPKVLRDFIKMTTNASEGNVDYDTARQFYQNAGALTADDASKLSKVGRATMARLLSQFRESLGQGIKDTAAQAGKLDEYIDAMKESRNAYQVRDIINAVSKKVLPTGVGTYILYKLLGKP